MLNSHASPASTYAFWAVMGASLVAGVWLLVAGHMLSASAVLLTGAGLGVVLALMTKPRSGVIDCSSSGLRRRGGAMAWGACGILAIGAVLWAVGAEAVWRVFVFAGVAGVLGSIGILVSARSSGRSNEIE